MRKSLDDLLERCFSDRSPHHGLTMRNVSPMDVAANTTTASWRHVAAAAHAYGTGCNGLSLSSISAVEATSFNKRPFARPTRRGAPPH